jgi:hypothetical protein
VLFPDPIIPTESTYILMVSCWTQGSE